MSDLVGRGSRLAMAASQGLRRLTGTSFFGPMCSPSRAHDAAAIETAHVGFKVSVARRLVDDRPWHAPDRGSAALRCRSLQIRQNTTPLRSLSGRSGASPYQRWDRPADGKNHPDHNRYAGPARSALCCNLARNTSGTSVDFCWLEHGAFGNIPGIAYRGCFSSVASLSEYHG